MRKDKHRYDEIGTGITETFTTTVDSYRTATGEDAITQFMIKNSGLCEWLDRRIVGFFSYGWSKELDGSFSVYVKFANKAEQAAFEGELVGV